MTAKGQQKSNSDVIRDLLERELKPQQAKRLQRTYAALEKVKGICQDALGDVSSRVNDILYGPQGAWKGRNE